ncbi:ion transporter, partial [Marinimicrobium sp. UBA4509]
FIIFYIYAAIGSMFFASVNEELWGDIAISMLTLFRIMTFEDWTDVMYETMVDYPFSWVFYVTFIFLSAFAFLNMIIGIVVNVLDEQHRKERQEEGEPTLRELQSELRELKDLVRQSSRPRTPQE